MWFSRASFAGWDPARLLCCGIGLLAALVMELSGIGRTVDLQATNWLFQRVGTRFSPSPEIVLVTIDDASLQLMEGKVGRWPWPRSQFARLAQACDGATSIGIDILLLERDRFDPVNDQAFATVLKQSGRVALAGAFVDDLVRKSPGPISPIIQRSILRFDGESREIPVQYLIQQFLTPVPLIGEAASCVGHANFFPSNDRILRTYPYWVSTDQGLMPSLALAALMVAREPKAEQLRIGEMGGDQAIRPRELVFYHQPFRRVSAIDLLEPSTRRLPSGWANGKIVLIGVEARGLHDLRITPLGERSGLDIHATALSNWLQRAWIYSPPPFALLFMAGLFGVFPIFLWNQSLSKSLISWVLCIAGYVALAGLVFHLILFRLPYTSSLIAFGAAALYRLADTVRRERILRKHLEELQRMKEMLANMLVHDLNSPLNSMRMLIGSILPEQPAGSKIQRRLEKALAEGSRLSNLIRTLLDIERMKSDRMQLFPSRFRWDDLVRETVLRLAPRASQRELKIEVEHDRLSIEVHGDSVMLGRVLVNLLENALQHATTGSVIICKTLAEQPQKGWLTLKVMNHGPVIPVADQNIIFEHFVQKRRERGGFGLGLAFSRLAILAHNGMLRCESPVPEWKEGAIFEFTIPIVVAADAEKPATDL